MPDATPFRSGLTEVELPAADGLIHVRGILPTLGGLIRRDLVPTHLRDIAIRSAKPEWLSEVTATPEGAEQAREFVALVVATFVRERWVESAGDEPGAWEPVTVTPADLDAGAFTDEALDLLQDLVLRIRTARQVSAIARLLRGMQIADVEPEEVPAAILAWETFRGQPGSAPAGPDGEPLAEQTESVAASAGRGRGVRARRGAGRG